LKVKIKEPEESLDPQQSVKQDFFQQTSENKIERSSPDGRESVSEEIPNQEVGKEMNQQNQKCLEPQQLFEIQNKELVEQNRELEESLEMMSCEFQSLEDYWQRKIEDERYFYTNQLSANERQFHDLESKINEYEQLMLLLDQKQKESPYKLSPIEEQKLWRMR